MSKRIRTRAAIRADIEKAHREHERAVAENAAKLPDVTKRVCELAAELRECVGLPPYVARDGLDRARC